MAFEVGHKLTGIHDNSTIAGMKLRNPIPDVIRDRELLFEKVIPYSTVGQYSAHRLLSFLYELYEGGTLVKGVTQKISEYAFGGGLDIQKSARYGWVRGKGQLTGEDEALAYIDALEVLGIDLSQVIETSNALYKHESICGTSFLNVRISTTNGESMATFEALHPMNVVRIFDNDDPKSMLSSSVVISETPIDGLYKYNEKSRTVPLFPNVAKRKGVIETVFQMNAPGYEKDFWGRGKLNTYWQYVDYNESNFLAKVGGSELTAKVIVFMKDAADAFAADSTDAGMIERRENSKVLKELTSNRGENPESIIAFHYPDEKPSVERLDIPRDPNFLGHTAKRAGEEASLAYGFDVRLFGRGAFTSSIGGNIVLDTLVTANSICIKPTQRRYERFFDRVLYFILSQTGKESLTGNNIKFENQLDAVIAELQALRQTKSTNEVQNPIVAA